jgi:hypothetical protein
MIKDSALFFLIILGAIALVCEKSSTEDVQKWFNSIGITDEITQKYGGLGYLDGETIFNDYSLSIF